MGILGENNYWYKIDALIRLSEQMYWHGERSMSCLAAVWSFFLGGGGFFHVTVAIWYPRLTV